MDFPQPYNGSQIKLNQNLSLVSDLVNPKQLEDSMQSTDRPTVSLEGSSMVKYGLNKTNRHIQAMLNLRGTFLFQLIGDKQSEKIALSFNQMFEITAYFWDRLQQAHALPDPCAVRKVSTMSLRQGYRNLCPK